MLLRLLVLLSEKELRFEAVVIGGAALIIMDIVDRKTTDIVTILKYKNTCKWLNMRLK